MLIIWNTHQHQKNYWIWFSALVKKVPVHKLAHSESRDILCSEICCNFTRESWKNYPNHDCNLEEEDVVDNMEILNVDSETEEDEENSSTISC